MTKLYSKSTWTDELLVGRPATTRLPTAVFRLIQISEDAGTPTGNHTEYAYWIAIGS